MMAIDRKDLRVGAIVRLASGSPKMAVLEAPEAGDVKVLWWSDRLGILTDVFPVELLVYPRPGVEIAATDAPGEPSA